MSEPGAHASRSSSPSPPPSPSSSSWLRQVLTAFGPLVGLVAVCVLFAALRFHTFLTRDNFAIIMQQTAVIGVAALGMTLVIIAGGIDLSVGSVIALGTVVVALLLQRGLPPWLAALGGVGACALCGAFSGLLITRLRLLPFVVTLGMMGALRGAAKGLAHEQPVYPDESWLNGLMQLGGHGGLPSGVWLMLGLAALVAGALRITRFGRHVFAVGSNELTARLCGVPVERVKLAVYVLGGAFAGVGAVLQFAYLTGGDPTTASGLELDVIAAVVIGGASLAGGQGTVTGTLVGALIMSVVANGCTKLGLSNWVQEIVTGGIIIAAVLLDYLRRRSAAGDAGAARDDDPSRQPVLDPSLDAGSRASSHVEEPDAVLIGSGVMSANLGALLKRLDPALRIQVYEAAGELAYEASNGWNNAGTGHAGICELSYTPRREPDGTVNVQKVIDIFQEFEQSLQFWARAVESGMIDAPRDFINPLPHISFVHGNEQVEFLRARHAGMSAHHFFAPMEFTTERAQIGAWAPLLVEGRDPAVPVAATKMDGGTDVNFGVVSRKLLAWLGAQPGCGVAAACRVVGLARARVDQGWDVTTRDRQTGQKRTVRAKFVFVGAGGGSLSLLQMAGLPEAKGLGGFPIGGRWLVCDDPAIVAKHRAKVYGQALEAAPTMAVPHLDTRVLDGQPTLLFGPFAAWTTRFLHRTGSWTDLPRSVKPHNLLTLIKIAAANIPLCRYLIQEGSQSMARRMKVLHIFYPGAQAKDWRLVDAGIRVQAIKKTDGQAGIVHYGTEVLTSADRSMSALLGASPGASVSVNIMLEVIKTSFPHLVTGDAAQARLRELVPTAGDDMRLPANAARFAELQRRARRALQLE